MWVKCVALTVLHPSKAGGFSTFATSARASVNGVLDTQLELANESGHKGGFTSNQAAYK